MTQPAGVDTVRYVRHLVGMCVGGLTNCTVWVRLQKYDRSRDKLAERAPNVKPASSIPRPTPRMDSKTSGPSRPDSVEIKTTTIPRVPQEIADEILDHLSADPDSSLSLQSCSLVSKSWVPSCRRHLFHTIVLAPMDMARWLEVFPAPKESPARHVRDLRFSIQEDPSVPEKFFEYTQWFSNAERMTFWADGLDQPLRISSSWQLPQSVTSLTIGPEAMNTELMQIRNIMAQLPNLNDLSLSGSLGWGRAEVLHGIGTGLRGRFGGQLRLLGGLAREDTLEMLLEIPTGLHFTEVRIESMHGCLISAARLAEACSKTLVKLSYAVSFYGQSRLFSWYPVGSSARNIDTCAISSRRSQRGI